MSLSIQKAVLRAVSRLGETERLLGFYRANHVAFLLPRPQADFENAVRRGQHFVVEVGAGIVGASGVFDYGDDLPYVEISETLVLPLFQGFGMQSLFTRLRVASVAVTQGPNVAVTTAIAPSNTGSLANMRGNGFVPWAAPIEQAYANCPTCPAREGVVATGRKCCCDFYSLPCETVADLISQLLTESASGTMVLTRSGGETLEVDCSACAILSAPDLRAALQDVVRGQGW